jgi:hypothetical protein
VRDQVDSLIDQGLKPTTPELREIYLAATRDALMQTLTPTVIRKAFEVAGLPFHLHPELHPERVIENNSMVTETQVRAEKKKQYGQIALPFAGGEEGLAAAAEETKRIKAEKRSLAGMEMEKKCLEQKAKDLDEKISKAKEKQKEIAAPKRKRATKSSAVPIVPVTDEPSEPATKKPAPEPVEKPAPPKRKQPSSNSHYCQTPPAMPVQTQTQTKTRTSTSTEKLTPMELDVVVSMPKCAPNVNSVDKDLFDPPPKRQ